jgi:hypothetical protein
MNATHTCPVCKTVLGIPESGVPELGIECNWCGERSFPKGAGKATAAPVVQPDSTKEKPRKRPAGTPAPDPIADDLALLPSERVGPVRNDDEYAERRGLRSTGPDEPEPIIVDEDDSDDGPATYDLPPPTETTKKCEACTQPIAISDMLCHHCGYDHVARRVARREYTPVDAVFRSGWSLKRRLIIFGAMQAINLIVLVGSVAQNSRLGVAICGTFVGVAMQAFLLGTYEQTRGYHLCFIPLPVNKVNWRVHEKVGVAGYDGTSGIDWAVMFMLGCTSIIGAILWYFMVINSPRYYCALLKDHDFPSIYLYRGMSHTLAREIGQVVSDCTGLPFDTPI